MMLLFGVVSYKVRPPRLVSNAFLYTTHTPSQFSEKKLGVNNKVLQLFLRKDIFVVIRITTKTMLWSLRSLNFDLRCLR